MVQDGETSTHCVTLCAKWVRGEGGYDAFDGGYRSKERQRKEGM